MNVEIVDLEELEGSVTGAAVVIDVLRAFSTAAYAFGGGAERIIMVPTLDDALALKAEIPGAWAFCDGPPREGFELANSPAQLQDHLDCTGRTVVQRTGNGTRGVLACRDAELLLCTGFLTAGPTARTLLASGLDHVTLVVTEGDEDIACAEHLSVLLHGDDPGDRFWPRVETSNTADRMRIGLERGHRGIDPRDFAVCSEVDRFDFAMRARHEAGHLVLRPFVP